MRMKRILSLLLTLMLALSGMASAEESAENTNLAHMLELCQRVDLLVRSDRMVSDWVQGTDDALAEDQQMVNRLRAGDRTAPSAVYCVTGEEMKRAFIGDNADYADREEQRSVLQEMPLRILLTLLDDYQASLLNNLTRTTVYATPDGEPDMGMYIVLYADALPMLGAWVAGEADTSSLYCVPVLSDELAACQSAADVSAWFERVNMPAMTCTAVDLTDAHPCAFAEGNFEDEGEPLAFETLAAAGDALDAMIADRYLQTAWGASDEEVAPIAAYAHHGAMPRAIYRLDLMGTQYVQMIQLLYRAEPPQVRYEAVQNFSLFLSQTLFQAQYQTALSDKLRAFIEQQYPSDEEASDAEDGGKLYRDETDADDLDAITIQTLYDQVYAHYTLLGYANTSLHCLNQPERVMAAYLLLYDSGAPILIVTSVEYGVTMLTVRYQPAKQLMNAKSATDVMLYLTGCNQPMNVTEILPQPDAAEEMQ